MRRYNIKKAIFFSITDEVVEKNIPENELVERLTYWNGNADVYTDYYQVEI